MVEILFFVLAFVAGVIGTVAGFGSSTILLPVSLFFMDFKTALTLVAFYHIFGNLGKIAFFRHDLNKRLILLFGVPSVIFALIGSLFIIYLPPDILKLILGIFLLIFSITFILKPNLKFSGTQKSAFIGGSLSGLLAGLIGVGGAIRGVFLTGFNLEKRIYIATAAAIALAIDITRIPVYLTNNFLSQQFFFYLPALFIIAIAASYTGKRIVDKIPQKAFKKVVLYTIAIVSIKFIFDGINLIG